MFGGKTISSVSGAGCQTGGMKIKSKAGEGSEEQMSGIECGGKGASMLGADGERKQGALKAIRGR